MMISKELFVEVLESAKKCNDYQDWFNKAMHTHGAEGYVFQPNCIDDVVKLLYNIFKELDPDDMISYFCFELDFGRKWKEGMVIDKDGNDIKLSSPEDLYDYLMSQGD